MRTLSFALFALAITGCSDATDTKSDATDEVVDTGVLDDTGTVSDTGDSGEAGLDEDAVPDVGWTAEFVTRGHGVSGTAVVIDESTIEIRDFTFDGGGVDAHIFLGIDGEAFSEDIELTDNLVGTVFEGETLTLTIPQGVSFEDWNWITLWCIPFTSSFGDGVFLPPDE